MANEEKVSVDKSSESKKPVQKKKSNRAAKFFREMRSELKKVLWPTSKQTMYNTGIALVFMAVAAVVMWGFDSLASGAVQALMFLTAG